MHWIRKKKRSDDMHVHAIPVHIKADERHNLEVAVVKGYDSDNFLLQYLTNDYTFDFLFM